MTNTAASSSEYITIQEAARELKVGSARVRVLVSDGKLASKREDGRRLVLRSDVEKRARGIADGTVKPGKPRLSPAEQYLKDARDYCEGRTNKRPEW